MPSINEEMQSINNPALLQLSAIPLKGSRFSLDESFGHCEIGVGQFELV